jgi:hypothetical protein
MKTTRLHLTFLLALLLYASCRGAVETQGAADIAHVARKLRLGDGDALAVLSRGDEKSLAILRELLGSYDGLPLCTAARVAQDLGRQASSLAPVAASRLSTLSDPSDRLAVVHFLAASESSQRQVLEPLWQAMVMDRDVGVRNACAEACARLDGDFVTRILQMHEAGGLNARTEATALLVAAGKVIAPELVSMCKRGLDPGSPVRDAVIGLGWRSSYLLSRNGMTELACLATESQARKWITLSEDCEVMMPRIAVRPEQCYEFFAEGVFRSGTWGVLHGQSVPDGRIKLLYASLPAPWLQNAPSPDCVSVACAILKPADADELRYHLASLQSLGVKVVERRVETELKTETKSDAEGVTNIFEISTSSAITSLRVVGALVVMAADGKKWEAHCDGCASTFNTAARWPIEMGLRLVSEICGNSNWIACTASREEAAGLLRYVDAARHWKDWDARTAESIARGLTGRK